MEHSEKGAEVTRWVELWLINDGDYYPQALDLALAGEVEELGKWVSGVLRTARMPSAAWHTARELAPNDYARVDWADIARTLTAE